MKKLLLLSFTIISSILSSQKFKIDTLLTDKISIRAIQLWNGKVWYAGSMSKFGYVNIRNPKLNSQIKLNSKNQEFRTIARFKENYFETVNVSSPAQFYGVYAMNLKVSELNKSSDSLVFFDSFKVNVKNNNGIAISDPFANGKPNFIITTKKAYLHKKERKLPTYYKGEAHFAASNSNIAMVEDDVWIATGGSHARVFKFNWENPYDWQVFETPFIQGTSSQGIYSIDFYDKNFGIAVGGDYTKQADNINNIATTKDGGQTWQIQASGENAGYITCVKFRPKTKGKDIVAVGDQHISFSSDYGKTWTKISDEKNLYACDWLDNNTLILAGKNRIIRFKFD